MNTTIPFLGELLALLSAIAFSISNVCISLTGKSGGDRGVMFSVLVTMVLSALLWLGLEGGAVLDGAGFRGFESAAGVTWFALAGVSAMVFGRSLIYESIRRLGVARASAVKRLSPFFSVILAAALLGERLYLPDVLGMAAICCAFALLIRENWVERQVSVGAVPLMSYGFGVGASLAYASAYVMRKIGLETLPSPAFGTFVSAVAGFAVFVVLAVFLPRYRSNFAQMFSNLDRFVVGAAVLVSLGQILMFAALSYAPVSTVVMIASLEIFMSMFLSVVVLRSDRRVGPLVLAAAGLATVGVVLVAF